MKSDGSFELVKVPVGDYAVMIAPIPEIDDPMDPTPRPPSSAQVFKRVDRKFGKFSTSGIEVSVKNDETTPLDLDISK